MNEVLTVPSNRELRALDRLQLEDRDGCPPLGAAQIHQAEISRGFDNDVIHDPAGSGFGSSGVGPAALRSNNSTSSEIASVMKRSGENTTAWTVEIVLAYLARNSMDPDDLPKLISDLNKVLRQISEVEFPVNPALRPAVPIGDSVTPEYVICLEDGRHFKSMRRHLRTAYNLTPEAYRDKWNLPESYPMVAPNYTAECSVRAKSRKFWNKSSSD